MFVSLLFRHSANRNTIKMRKAITYSLFKGDSKDCHSFDTFIRFLTVTLRAHHELYKGFDFVLNIDEKAYISYRRIFDSLVDSKLIVINKFPLDKLTRAMLWRIDSMYDYDYAFCRDLDSIPTMRERQAVQQFMDSDCVAHAMNDSVSHTVPMMGGMIGFNVGKFKEVYPKERYKRDVDSCGIDFNIKGADQTFINRFIFPLVKTKLFAHKILGMNCNNDTNCTNVVNAAMLLYIAFQKVLQEILVHKWT